MVDRIRQLLAWQQLSPTQFADLIGVGRPVVSHILSERNKPSLDVVQRVIAAFPAVSLPWLLSGVGEMLTDPDQVTPATAAAPPVVVLASPQAPILATISAPAAQVGAAVSEIATPTAVSAPVARRASVPVAPPLARFVASKPATARVTAPLPPPVAATLPPAMATAPGATPAPIVASAPVVTPPAPIPSPQPIAATAAPLATAEPGVVAASTPAVPTDAAALLPFAAEPGKPIRRIVIFYRDGSFGDYLPEG